MLGQQFGIVIAIGVFFQIVAAMAQVQKASLCSKIVDPDTDRSMKPSKSQETLADSTATIEII